MFTLCDYFTVIKYPSSYFPPDLYHLFHRIFLLCHVIKVGFLKTVDCLDMKLRKYTTDALLRTVVVQCVVSEYEAYTGGDCGCSSSGMRAGATVNCLIMLSYAVWSSSMMRQQTHQ